MDQQVDMFCRLLALSFRFLPLSNSLSIKTFVHLRLRFLKKLLNEDISVCKFFSLPMPELINTMKTAKQEQENVNISFHLTVARKNHSCLRLDMEPSFLIRNMEIINCRVVSGKAATANLRVAVAET